ncbi:MAG TPA: HEAT repeat domain-containing protein [Phycisphaerae bacterium]|nr:HEAT repeat domain-containing protein [Phycisphaerae bacterium]
MWRCLLVCAALLCFPVGSAVAQTDDAAVGPTVPEGAPVATLFEDFLHFARLGRFELADAYARQLLEHPDLDPVKLLEVSGRDPRSLETLMLIIDNSPIGQSAARVLEVVQQGEFQLRQDVARIKANIEKLGGSPQMEFHAIERLIESGEYAVPWMLQTLRDPDQARLHPRILAALPRLGRPAINPLVTALATEDQTLRGHVVRTLGGIGYPQAVPYLQRQLVDSSATPEIKSAASEAIGRIAERSGRPAAGSPGQGFFQLATQYYEERGSVAADPRLPSANVWYWDAENSFLKAVPVPQRIFGPVMAMRCCQEALRIDPGDDDAIALWLAADIRREARLGLDVESPQPGEPEEADDTRPEDFPPSLYFTRAAGARYAHLVLDRAVRDGDAQVALGAIAALRVIAGTASLIGTQDYKQPLVQALEFPDRVVRIRAALALGNALPRSPFAGAERVVPVLVGALSPTQTERLVVVDPDADNRNRLAAEFRQAGAQVVTEADFYKAIDRARSELDWVSAFVLAVDIDAPGIAVAVDSLRRESAFAGTAIIVLARPAGSPAADDLASRADNIEAIDATAERDEIADRLDAIRASTGQAVLDADAALELAFEAASTLQRIANAGATVLDCRVAEPALIAALSADDEELRLRCTSVLALLPTVTAQQAIADLALNVDQTESLRMAAFSSLADSAKTIGNRLDDARVQALLSAAREEPDLTMRTAASQALGALNLSDNQASEIIRSYSPG